MVKIITDTTSCLPVEIAEQYSIPVIPQIINLGSRSYYEGIDIDNDTFLKELQTMQELPKTAAPPPELFVKTINDIARNDEAILCIHPSEDVSGTIRSATVAAQEFPDIDIRVVDTRTIGSPLGTMVQLAAEWAANGMEIDSIEENLMEMIPRCKIYFLVDTLEFLAKGGRIGGASALLGNILQIKPILIFKDGTVDQFEKERTHKRALNRLLELVVSQSPHEANAYISIMHADAHKEAENLTDQLKIIMGLEHIPIRNIPPAIITHGGPGILGVGFFTKRAT